MSDKLSWKNHEPTGRYDVLASHPSPNPWIFASGYLSAAQTLVENCKREGMHASEDKFLYPILFLLRHALELHLKEYAYELRDHLVKNEILPGKLKIKLDAVLSSDHKLTSLFDVCQQLANLSPIHALPPFDELRPVVLYWHDLDVKADTFRYTRTNKGDTAEVYQQQWWANIDAALNDVSSICLELQNAGLDETIWLYDQRLVAHQHLSLLQEGQELFDQLLYTLPPDEMAADSAPVDIATFLENHKEETLKEQRRLAKFVEVADGMTDRQLALALYCFYVGRNGIDWTIQTLEKTKRKDLIRILREKSCVFTDASRGLKQQINLLHECLARVDKFYPQKEQIDVLKT
jgi:hypothetical protein